MRGILMALVLAMVLTGCKTKYVSVPEYHTEYAVRVDSVEKWDSIWCHDSVYVFKDGDTITMYKYRERFVYKYLDRVRVDSFIKTDSIRVPYPVEVEKRLTMWQKVRNAVPLAAFLWVITFVLIYFMRRFFS